MTIDSFGLLAEEHRDLARSAFHAAFGGEAPASAALISGGASGASLLRVAVRGRLYVVRVEGPATSMLPRNRHRYACARLASDAGIGPAIRYLDEMAGVVITDFVAHRPLGTFPGGPIALAAALGGLLRRLQTGPQFPQLVYYPDLVTRLLVHLRESGAFAEGLLNVHLERVEEIRHRLDWDTTPGVPSHNDLNPGNILFDGERLWLIDWESAYRNHPLVDVSVLLDSVAGSPEAEHALLGKWCDGPPAPATLEALSLVRPLVRLYYACFLLNAAWMADRSRSTDLVAPNPGDLAGLLRSARRPPPAEAMRSLGRVWLEGFLHGKPLPEMPQAVASFLHVS